MLRRLKVLGSLGLTDIMVPWEAQTEWTAEDRKLWEVDLTYVREQYGYPTGGVRRSTMLQRLADSAIANGIDVNWGWELNDIRETDNGVVAQSKDGREVTGSFLVGCDGIHSRTRALVLKKHGISDLPADFKRMVQVGNQC